MCVCVWVASFSDEQQRFIFGALSGVGGKIGGRTDRLSMVIVTLLLRTPFYQCESSTVSLGNDVSWVFGVVTAFPRAYGQTVTSLCHAQARGITMDTSVDSNENKDNATNDDDNVEEGQGA